VVAAPRPTQIRSLLTRRKIVDAAGRALARRGFGGASTQAVATAAGVSQGALFKHFSTKAELFAASVEKILGGFVARFRSDASATPAPALDDRIAVAVAALWGIFRRPEMQAVFEVYVAARTDAGLGRALAPILDRHRENIHAEARRMFPELATATELASVVDAVVYAMQGVVLGLFAPDRATDAEHLAFFERLARREIEAVVPTGARRRP
jgi:AcrR family transcriptional regulator